MIELVGFGKDYGDFTAVEELNLKIDAGEMFGFIGPNGAGKSTTIRFLATLLKASRGEGIVNGHSVTDDPMNVRRSVGYMPDNFGVYDGMKVWEFLDFFAVAYRIWRSRNANRSSPTSRVARSDSQTRRLRERPVARHEAALVSGQDAGPRSAGADPRRAGQRSRSAARVEVKALLKELRRMGKTILDFQPHSDRAGRLLHVDRDHRTRQAADARSDRGRLSPHSRTRTVVVKFTDNMDVGLSIIRSSPHPRSVEVDDHSATIELETDDAGVAEVLDQLTSQGVGIRSFAEKDPTLEDVFMMVTKGLVS